MEEFASLWSYQEGIDELKQKLLYTTIELESLKMEANQEIIKNKENMKNLLNLLQMAYKERDEAKDQLQKLLNKFMLSSNFQAESPLVKANSSITESNSLSGSPVDSFFDAVSSPDSGNMATTAFVANVAAMDPSALVIENIVKGTKLPEKGRLLQSVMEAGPLLQTLLVAGPLPRWRNPPPLQPFKIPPVLINGQDMSYVEQKPAVMSRGTPRMCSTSMLNFSGPSSSFGSQIPSAKRQRFH